MMMLKALIANWLKEQAHEQVLGALREALDPSASTGGPATPPPPCEVVLVFGSAFEAGGVVDLLEGRLTLHNVTHREHSGRLGNGRVAVVEAPPGPVAVATAVWEAIRVHRPRWLISAGFASSLSAEIRRGHIVMANAVADATGQKIPIPLHLDPRSLRNNPALHVGLLLTVERLPRTPADRQQLAATQPAAACDLETWGAAEVCRQTQTPFLSVRVITETLSDLLPDDLEKLLAQKSTVAKLGATAGSIWRRPAAVKDLWRVNEDALKAADRMARFLTGLVSNLPLPPRHDPPSAAPA